MGRYPPKAFGPESKGSMLYTGRMFYRWGEDGMGMLVRCLLHDQMGPRTCIRSQLWRWQKGASLEKSSLR